MGRLGFFASIISAALIAIAGASTAFAQDDLNLPQLDLPEPNAYAPTGGDGALQSAFAPTVTLLATLTPEGEPLTNGLIWRVFGTAPGIDGKLPLIATAQGGTTQMQLQPGTYFLHATVGRASASTRINVTSEPISQQVVLNAGGLRLNAMLPDGSRMRQGLLTFDI